MAAVLAAAALLALSGCTAAPIVKARGEFYGNQPQMAAATLADPDAVSRRDRLLYLMEKGLILHQAGQYKESIDTLRAADRLMEEQDIINLGQQSASLVTNDWVTAYKGEYSERLWVHTYLMMNYLLVYRYEEALVEAKRALKRIKDAPEALDGAYFTRALAALCYENLDLYNDAYIEYRKLAADLQDPAPLAPDLYRLALRLGFADEARKYKRMLPPGHAPDLDAGELVIFAGFGKGPVKVSGNIVLPPSIRFSFPQYQDRATARGEVTGTDADGPLTAIAVTTNLNAVARSALSARGAALAAKETARAGLKEAMAQAAESANDEMVALFARAILFIMEEADTRGWETLPAALTLARFRLPPGQRRNVVVRIATPAAAAADAIRIPRLELKPGQRRYYSIRAY